MRFALFDDKRPGYPPQIWFVVAMLLLLLGLVITIILGYAPRPPAQLTDGLPSPWVGERPLVPADPTETPTTAPTGAPSALGTITPRRITPMPTPTSDPLYVASTRLANRPQEDHLWLARPIAPDGTDQIAPYYPYGSRADGTYPIHQGVEFVNRIGTEVLATAPGTIVVAGDDSRQAYGADTDYYGLLVVEQLDQTYLGQPVYVLCGHLSEILVQAGQRVETGDVIARVGMSGIAEGPHVHLEVRFGANLPENTANPELWFRPHADRGGVAGLVVAADDSVASDVHVQLYRAEQPNTLVREVVTYPNRTVNPDPSWGENFAAGDLTAGRWVARVYRNRLWHTTEFTVTAGSTTWLRILVTK
jgi:murein DD-endopeptidase MepM/ murein hydrolase activator NlpD